VEKGKVQLGAVPARPVLRLRVCKDPTACGERGGARSMRPADVPHLPKLIGGITHDGSITRDRARIPRIFWLDQWVGGVVLRELNPPGDVVLLGKISAHEKRELAVLVGDIWRQHGRPDAAPR